MKIELNTENVMVRVMIDGVTSDGDEDEDGENVE